MKLCASNRLLAFATALASTAASSSTATATTATYYFDRVSTFEVCEQIDANCDTDTETGAETLWFFEHDGKNNLVYTDSEQKQLGFVDVTDPSNPIADGVLPLDGEPSTVRVIGDYVVVGVNTSPDYVNPTGQLDVIRISDRVCVDQIELPGQPDAVDVSKEDSGYPKYIAVAIENERDEDLGDGSPPQMPPGYLEIITIEDEASLSNVTTWTQTTVSLTGWDGICRFPDDPEPEYVAISAGNDCVVVTLQENNCNILVDLITKSVVSAFDAGEVDLTNIDTEEEDVIDQDGTGTFLREPDGVTWIGSTPYFATANEGDLDGGSRGFTIFDSATGDVVYDSGSSMDIEVARIGHYDDGRSGNKGNEPENVLYGETDDGCMLLFVAAERSSCVFVYEVSDPTEPVLLQVLPTGIAPEGLAFDAATKTLAVAAEKDNRKKGYRSSITLYSFAEMDEPFYPTLESMPREDNPETFIPFSALSGLAASPDEANVLFTVEDDTFRKSRILCIDTDASPACVFKEDYIVDTDGVLEAALGSGVVNSDDGTVNLDLEGIAAKPTGGGYWVVSKSDKALICVSADYVVESVVFLPVGCDNLAGVEADGDKVIVVQGEADDDNSNPLVVVYDTVTEETKSAQFVLEAPLSQYGGKVCLTDIAFYDGTFYVLQDDEYAGKDSAIKRIYTVDLDGYSFDDGSILESELYRDLIPDLTATNGVVPEKVEGLTVDADGNVFVVNDNGGMGEISFLKVADASFCGADATGTFGAVNPRSGRVLTGTCEIFADFVSTKGPGRSASLCRFELADGTGKVFDMCRATCAEYGKGPCVVDAEDYA